MFPAQLARRAAPCLLATFLLTSWSCTAADAPPAPAFGAAYGNAMVLPHGEDLILTGTATPNAGLTLQVEGDTYRLRSDAQGAWRQEVKALRAGGPYTVSLQDESGARTTLSDVLAGEVWLCSGQSNMEYSAGRSIDQPADLLQGHPSIRLLSIAHQTSLAARQAFAEAPTWGVANVDATRRFSAVCYFFARRRIEEHGLPIGLINASWGGSAIEAWISERALAALPGYSRQVSLLQQYRAEPRRSELAFAEDWVKWWQASSTMGPVWQRGVLDGNADWQAAPLQDWRGYADPRLKSFTGNLWFSADFGLTAEQSRKGASFVLGKIDEVDTTWLNGKFVGNTFGYGTRREYRLEPGMLQPGTNQFSVFVTNTYDAGGMTGPEADVGIRFDDGEFVPLGSRWKYRIVPKAVGYPPRAPWESVAGVSGMFNGMVAPLQGLPPTGVIWYQGESNTEQAGAYGQLLAALIKDWRGFFGRELPFIVVQLPNYGAVTTGPVESGWAMLRNAQQQVALADPRVGLAVTQDLGEDADIHPRRKYAVAERVLQVARALRDGGVPDGVVARHVAGSPDTVSIEFEPTLAATTTVRRVPGFSLCGPDAAACVSASAEQHGSRIRIDRSALPGANRLRYCWSDGGTCSLTSAGGLPVTSFELPLQAAPTGN